MPEKVPSFLNEKTYKDIFDLSNLTAPFKSLLKEVLSSDNEPIWKQLMETDDPLSVKLPENLEVKLDLFQKMTVLKLFR